MEMPAVALTDSPRQLRHFLISHLRVGVFVHIRAEFKFRAGELARSLFSSSSPKLITAA